LIFIHEVKRQIINYSLYKTLTAETGKTGGYN
jgi:hypothetical protein